jgi:alanyl-tRNA synthetase
VGGKGGGKDDGATGFGTEGGRTDEAVEVARKVFEERK